MILWVSILQLPLHGSFLGNIREVMRFMFTVSFYSTEKNLSEEASRPSTRSKDKNILLLFCSFTFSHPLFFCWLADSFCSAGSRQVSSFWSGPGLAACVCMMLPGLMVFAEACFEALSVIQPCLVYQSYMSHTTVIWSRAVSTTHCYSCCTVSPAKERAVTDWLTGRVVE